MKYFTKALSIACICLAGTAFAKDGVTNPVVKDRMDLMQTIRQNTSVLGDMASGKTAFDAALAAEARAGLSAAAALIPAKFEAEETDPVDEAKPDIWMMFDDFTSKAETLLAAAESVDATSLEALQGSMRPVGGACQSCHEAYRAKK
jgi:cytochrome c556